MSEHLSHDYKDKKVLYELLYDLKSVIQGKKVEINKEEFEENVQTTSMSQIVKYIKDIVPILVKTLRKDKSNSELQSSLQSNVSQAHLYQNRLKKLENKERKYIKQIFQHRLIRESLEMRISEYLQMEEDFEEMRVKFRYEEGKFLSNDRKDNEIIILRVENTNLKNEIVNLQSVINSFKKEISDFKDKILHQTQENQELKLQLDEKQKELNHISNININIHNTPHSIGGGTLTNHSNTTSYLYNTHTHNDLSTSDRIMVGDPTSNEERYARDKMFYYQLQHKIMKNRFNSDGSNKHNRNSSTGRSKIDFVSQFNNGFAKMSSNNVNINDSKKMKLKSNKSAANLMNLMQYPSINKGGSAFYRNNNNIINNNGYNRNFSGLGMMKKNNDK